MLTAAVGTAVTEEAPVLWYANRGSGFVLLALLTVTTVAGVLAGAAPGTREWPRAATQAMHRNIGLLSALFLAVHVVTTVVDEFVDVRWWQALVPFTSTYERVWLGLGVVALDLILAVILTSMLRHRLGHRLWHGVHVLAYFAWALGVVHGLAMGTDATTRWGVVFTAVCAMAVAVAVGARLVSARTAPPPSGVTTTEPVRVPRTLA
jgi:DMSO/TMAO reductase YedYZ heme-binding membrane subunit